MTHGLFRFKAVEEIPHTAFFIFGQRRKKIMIGKRIRMERIMDRNSGKTVIIPMDHGVTIGPIAGLIHMQETIDAVADGRSECHRDPQGIG